MVFERSNTLGGVWAAAYPEVRLQNLWNQYCLADFPWPFRPDDNPTAAQILRYLQAAVTHFGLDLRYESEVVALDQLDPPEQGWRARVRTPDGTQEHEFDYAVLAVGQYTQPKAAVQIADRERFRGRVVTERDIDDPHQLAGERVAIVGFGKSAVDLAGLAARRGSRVEHVFRTARWLVPERILGLLHYSFVLFTRFGTVVIPAWAQPTKAERFLHSQLSFVIRGFWATLGALVRMQYRAAALGKGPDARARIRAVQPEHSLISDMRSAAALAPSGYYESVARGEITPHRGVVGRFVEHGLVLTDGREIDCDVVVLCMGSGSPVFPFMSAQHRALLESEPDGVQLYRHMIHPRIPRLAFAGYNHGFMHVPATEVGIMWVNAVQRGELELPCVAQMEASIERVRKWKREHINHEPSRSCAINTRYHQYLDIMLNELGISPYRKSNPLAELFSRYEVADYAGLHEQYHAAQARHEGARQVLDLDT